MFEFLDATRTLLPTFREEFDKTENLVLQEFVERMRNLPGILDWVQGEDRLPITAMRIPAASPSVESSKPETK